MSNALIGYTGFVGGNLARQYNFQGLYNSSNIDEIAGRKYQNVICAGAPAAMWIANAEPEKDLANIKRLISSIDKLNCENFVLISTVAVYADSRFATEDVFPAKDELSAYGQNRLMLEEFVRARFDKHLVVRLPGLFGDGLKKNVIYDLLNNNNVDQIDARSVYQYYNLANLRKDIDIAEQNNLKLIHFACEPTSVAEVARYCFNLEFSNQLDRAPANWDFYTKHGKLWGQSGNYLYSKEFVLEQIKNFIKNYKK